MARIVGTASVKVTLDTTGLKQEVQRDVKDELKQGIKGDELQPGLDKNKKAAKKSAVDIGKIFAGIWSGVRSAAITGLVGLVPAAASSINQVAGLLGLLPAVALAGAAGFAVLKFGLQGIGQAFKDVGTKNFAKDLQSLAPAAANFVVQIHSLAGAASSLKLTLQQNLFAGLGPIVHQLGTVYLPILKDQLGGVASAFNSFGKDIGLWFNLPRIVADVNTALGNVRKAFAGLEPAFRSLLHIFDDLATVGSSFLPGLAKSVSDVTAKFAAFVDKARASGQLATFIQNGVTAFHQLTTLVGNLIAILVKLFSGLSAGGASLFQILDRITGALRKFLDSASGQQFVAALSEILRTIAQTIGPLLLVVLNALVPVVASLAPVISQVVVAARGGLISALQSLAQILVALTPSLVILANVVGVILVSALTIVTPLLKALAAVMGLNKVVTTTVLLAAGAATLGWLAWAKVLPKVIKYIKDTRIALVEMQLAQKLAAVWQAILNAVTAVNPWIIVAVAIIAVVTLIILNWNKVQKFLIAAWHEIIAVAKVVWGAIVGFFTDVWHAIQRVTVTVWNAISGFLKVIWRPALAVLTFGISLLVEFFIRHWNQIKQGTIAVWDAITGFLTRAWRAVVNSTRFIWEPIVGIIKDIFVILKDIVIIIVEGTAILLIKAWQGIVAAAEFIWKPLSAFFQFLWRGITSFLQGEWNLIVTIARAVWTPIAGFFTDLWNGITAVAQAVWSAITAFLQAQWQIIVTIYHTVIEPIGQFFAALWSGIESVVTTVWRAITGFLSDVWRAITTALHAVFDPIASFFAGIWDAVWRVIVAAWDKIKGAVSDAIHAVVSFVSALPGEILNALGDLGNLLLNAGKAVIEGFLNGLKSAFDDVKNFIGGVANWISSNKGPIEYDRQLLVPHGTAIMQGLLRGLSGQVPALTSFLNGVAGGIAGALQPKVALSGSYSASGTLGGSPAPVAAGGTTINAYQLPGMDVLQFANQVARLGAHAVTGGSTVPVTQQPARIGDTGKALVGVS